MSEWFVYILRCADDTLYIGITNDLIRRCGLLMPYDGCSMDLAVWSSTARKSPPLRMQRETGTLSS